MRKMLLFLLFINSICLSGQEKHDFVWLLGANPNNPAQNLGGTKIDFNQTPFEVTYFDIPIDFFAIAMISDAEGNLLFYTNGCEIINYNHTIIPNGNGINKGLYHDLYCGDNVNIGYPLSQGVLALPIPQNNRHYVLFHYMKEDIGEKKNLLYSIINMNTSDALGIVENKNQILLTDYMADMLTAVRHANGRDWWIVSPKTDTEEGYLFLLTPSGIEGPLVRDFGQYWDINGANGQAVFSPDGTKYARTNRVNGLHIANFNRCTGQFSNAIKINFPADTITSSGAAFSPNSRYLYVSASTKVYQFDTWASNIEATKQTVAIYDGFQSPFSTRFFQQMLTPDGKIYITTPSDNNVLHVIHNPNASGIACVFEQHGIVLPTMHFASAPNFPYFRLYDLAGSPCDTLGINGPVVSAPEVPVEKEGLRLWPNPASSEVLIHLTFPMENGQWTIVNIAGQAVKSGTWINDKQLRLSVQDLAAGAYYFTLTPESGTSVAAKLIITR